jgi:hypothetical protein
MKVSEGIVVGADDRLYPAAAAPKRSESGVRGPRMGMNVRELVPVPHFALTILFVTQSV